MKTSILRQYQIVLSKQKAMHTFRELYFKFAEPRQTDDTKATLKAKVKGFIVLRKLNERQAANQILKLS